jgi:hypothetical protein
MLKSSAGLQSTLARILEYIEDRKKRARLKLEEPPGGASPPSRQQTGKQLTWPGSEAHLAFRASFPIPDSLARSQSSRSAALVLPCGSSVRTAFPDSPPPHLWIPKGSTKGFSDRTVPGADALLCRRAAETFGIQSAPTFGMLWTGLESCAHSVGSARTHVQEQTFWFLSATSQ